MALVEQIGILEQENQKIYVENVRKTICFLGLEGCGKSSIVWSLKGERNVERPRTLGLNMLALDKPNVNIIDCSGLKVYRKLFWTQALKIADFVVFVIDASAPEKLKEVREALSFVYEELKDQSILFLTTKNDKVDVMSTKTIIKELELDQLKCPWMLMPVSAVTGMNLHLTELVLNKI